MSKNRIALLREAKKLTQEQLANKLEIKQQRLSQIESGSIEPTTNEIGTLIRELKSNFQDIFLVDDTTDEKCCGILITYVQLEEHVDPNYNVLVYGETGMREKVIKNILDENEGKDKYLFFNTTIGGKRYITGYFHINEVLEKGIHDAKIKSLPDCAAKFDDRLIITGNRKSSKILTFPLLLDKKLALSLFSLGFTEEQFIEESKELSIISNKTRQHRSLTEADTKILLNKCKSRG